MSPSEARTASLTSLWGEARLPTRRYRYHACHASLTAFADPNLDTSRVLPLVLERAEELALLLPYRAASRVLQGWGVHLSPSHLASLSQDFERVELEASQTRLRALAEQPLARTDQPARVWMLEVDGVIVPTGSQASGLEPSRGWKDASGVVWREVKSAVLYRLLTPSDRYQVSVLKPIEGFVPLVQGLLRHAGVTQNDVLVGLSDGAGWIANLFGEVGVHRHILDVYHASASLERLMLGLGWTDEQRLEERRRLCRGEVDARSWLNWWVRPTARDKLDGDGLEALVYLERQAELEHTRYPAFRVAGLVVIGSGEVEGANKSVIGARLKVSGAIWGVAGADGKAFARGMLFSKRRVVGFDHVRHEAFSRVA